MCTKSLCHPCNNFLITKFPINGEKIQHVFKFNFFNTLSHEDLYQHNQISQVKLHDLKLNEHETYVTSKQLIVSQSSDTSNKRHIILN